VSVKDLDELGEVGERSGEAVDLIDHNDIDPPPPHLGQELLQGRAVHGPTREAAIVITLCDQAPALMRL
jgi:hypothetical protein